MDIVFCFHFCDPNTDVVLRSLAFYADNVNTTLDKLHETMTCHTEKMDAQYGKQSGLFFASINLMSYNSVDISPDQHDLVMAAWRHAFVTSIAGCVVSDVYDVTNVGGNPEVYEYTKQAYQAQILRATLNTHAGVVQSEAPRKKM